MWNTAKTRQQCHASCEEHGSQTSPFQSLVAKVSPWAHQSLQKHELVHENHTIHTENSSLICAGSSIVSEIVGSIGESLSTVKSVVFRDAFIPRTSRRSTQVSDASSVLARMLPNLCSLTIMGASAGNAMLAFGTHCRKLSHLTVDVVTVPPMTSDLQTPMLATYTLTDRVRYRSSTSATADDDTSHAFKGHILASPNVLRSTSVTGLHFEQRLLGGCLSISDVPPDILNDLPPSIREFSTTFELPSVLLAHGFLSPLTDLVIPGLSTQWEIYGLVQRIGHLKTLALFSSYMILPEVMYIIKSHPHVLIMCELVELRGSGAELAAVLKSLPTMDCQHCALHAVDSFDAVGLMELARIFPDLVQLSLSCPRAPSESCLASLRSPSLFALIVQTPIPFSQNGLVSLCDSLPRLGALITCVTDGMETHQLALEEIMMAKGRLVHCHESTGF